MSSIRLNPKDNLIYNSEYQVLICESCQYAIQKSALRSHLLRHKIFRGERKQILVAIDQYHLLEPENVSVPNPSSPPVDSLPVVQGLRCTAAACGHLCASDKRMRRHWSEAHSCNELDESGYARDARLQTFFRGTKLRYFEVDRGLAENLDIGGTARIGGENEIDRHEYDEVRGDSSRQLLSQNSPEAPLQAFSFPPQLGTPLRAVTLDMGSLFYLHHFMHNTAATLPSILEDSSLAPARYWEQQIPHVTFHSQQQWLMCGLLALAAGHLQAQPSDDSKHQTHHMQFRQFFAAFTAGWNEEIESDHIRNGSEVKDAAVRIKCILRCIHWCTGNGSESLYEIKGAENPEVCSVIDAVRDLYLAFSPHASDTHSKTTSPDDEAEMQRQTQIALDMPPVIIGTAALTRILDSLRDLPSGMTVAFGRPRCIKDPVAVLAAIGALVECCTDAKDEFESHTWLAVTAWTTKLSRHFSTLAAEKSPAALLVVGYWVSILYERVRNDTCWWLKVGLQRLRSSVIRTLQHEDQPSRLLNELLSCCVLEEANDGVIA